MYGVCTPVWEGFRAIHMTTRSFLERPVRWLDAISHFRATHSGGPNFAYELCVKSVAPRDCVDLRLDCWRNAYSSGETVRAETLRRFAEAFAERGFRPDAFQPCYGISESTLRVAESPRGRFPTTLTLDRIELGRGHAVAVEGDSGKLTGVELVGYGPLKRSGKWIKIVDPDRCIPRKEGEVGEVWIMGRDVARGYWKRHQATRRTFRARLRNAGKSAEYLRTGDLGFEKNGELYLVGRLK
jgi:acyl-CoA synthetase (AMP-forming)/AMP-acid ligase II